MGVGLLAYYRLAGERSVFIIAQTQLLQIDGLELGTARFWNFSKVALCDATFARSGPSGDSQPRSGGGSASLCPPDMQTIHEGAAVLSFAAGGSITLTRRGLGPVLMSIPNMKVDDGQFSTIRFLGKTGSFEIGIEQGVVVAIDIPDQSPFSLAVRGILTLGTQEGGSGQAIVTGGRYEIRERLRLRSRPQVVTSGTIELGDVVRVVRARSVRQGTTASVSGHTLISVEDPGSQGLRLAFTATAEPRATEWLSDLALELTRMGFAPTRIEPTWTSRALADPLTYILGLFVTVIATSLAVVANALEIKGKRPDRTDEGSIEHTGDPEPKAPPARQVTRVIEVVPDQSATQPLGAQSEGSSPSNREPDGHGRKAPYLSRKS